MAALEHSFGRLDILVCNAGAARRGNFFTLNDRDWSDGFALKFFAHVRLCRQVWPHLKKAGGSVVFISGIGARTPVADYMIGAAVIGASHATARTSSSRMFPARPDSQPHRRALYYSRKYDKSRETFYW